MSYYKSFTCGILLCRYVNLIKFHASIMYLGKFLKSNTIVGKLVLIIQLVICSYLTLCKEYRYLNN